ncbi:MAG: hypothetical protein HY608_07735 [Planctomycetes bacterium]|nr:hypothetical protein [Planctomycetota bacterium]
MNSRTHRHFWRRYEKLPAKVQEHARETYRLFAADPAHGSLRFKPLQHHADCWSVRIGPHYRAVGYRAKGAIYWFWIGSHAEFDRDF